MRIAWVLVMVALAGAATARADDAADRDEARREFAAGQAADRQRDWTTAIEHYLRANDLVPHPNAMFNIAQDYERLGKLREAAIWYQRYIDTAQDSPDRDKVIRALHDLQARPGTITVRSKNPVSDARVSIDGAFVGVTPYSGHLKGGAHRVLVEYNDRRDEREVKIEFGEPAVVEIVLRPGTNTSRVATRPADDARKVPEQIGAAPRPAGEASGVLRITGQPVGALVAVDNRVVGKLPVELPIAAGPHTVQITQYGYQPMTKQVDVYPDQDTPLDAQLQTSLGNVDHAIRAGYILGGGGGADTGGAGAIYMAEAGVRANQYDVSARIGKLAGALTVDLVGRWTITKTRLAPFLMAGYSFIYAESTTGFDSSAVGGYLVGGGLRLDLSRGEHTGVSLLAEATVRYYSGVDFVQDKVQQSTNAATIVPIMTSLQITYK